MIINKLIYKENKIINTILKIKPKIFSKEIDYLFEQWNTKDFIKKINSDYSFTQVNQPFSEREGHKELNYIFNRLINVKLARVKEGIVFYSRQNSKTQINKYSILGLKYTKKIIRLTNPYLRNKLYKSFNKTAYIHK